MPNAVSVYDVSPLLLLSLDLGDAYQLGSRLPLEACRANLNAVRDQGRPDLIRTWSLANLIMAAW